MTDLDAAIRAKLNSEGLDGFESRPCLSVEGCDVNGFDEMRAALLAVLDLHRPREDEWLQVRGLDGTVRRPCRQCSGLGTGGMITAIYYPCQTVSAIAKGLGIELA